MIERTSFRFHVNTLSFGWCDVVMYANDKRIPYRASYLGENPIASMIEACADILANGGKYYIKWMAEPGLMDVDLELEENGTLHLDIIDDTCANGKTEWHETILFDDFVQAIKSEGFRVLNAFGLYGYRRSWMMDTEFPLSNLLYITGKCEEIWKGDACSTDIIKELEYLQHFLKEPELTVETSYAECSVYYEAWQLQCCGSPFSVGDTVEWSCILPEAYKNAHGILIDFEEEHHGFATHTITGIVEKIIAERSEFPKGERETWYNRAKCVHEEIPSANGWESKRKDDDNTDFTFWGYIVELHDVIVKPIIKDVEYGQK